MVSFHFNSLKLLLKINLRYWRLWYWNGKTYFTNRKGSYHPAENREGKGTCMGNLLDFFSDNGIQRSVRQGRGKKYCPKFKATGSISDFTPIWARPQRKNLRSLKLMDFRWCRKWEKEQTNWPAAPGSYRSWFKLSSTARVFPLSKVKRPEDRKLGWIATGDEVTAQLIKHAKQGENGAILFANDALDNDDKISRWSIFYRWVLPCWWKNPCQNWTLSKGSGETSLCQRGAGPKASL